MGELEGHYKQDYQERQDEYRQKTDFFNTMRFGYTPSQCLHFAAQYIGLLATVVLMHVI